MKKFIIGLLVFTGIIYLVVLYERIFTNAKFGPSMMLALAAMGVLFLLLLITLLLYDTRFRERMNRLWIVLISATFAYLIADMAAGYFLIKPLSPQLSPDLYRHHKLIPNTFSRFEQREFSYVQRVNNVGLRGKDIQIKKSPDTYRIVMLGDSFTMGKGVEDDQTFSAILEKYLNLKKMLFIDKNIEVLNAGVDSYAPILSFLQLTKDLEQIQPDIVILNLDISDLVQETVYRKQAIIGENGDVIGVPGGTQKMGLTERIRIWTDQHLYLTRLILFYTNKIFNYSEFTIRNMVTQANYELAMHTLTQDTENREEQWDNIYKSIINMKIYCDSKGIKFILTIYPWGHQVSEREWMPGRYNGVPKESTISDASVQTLKTFAKNNKIELFNMYPNFRSYKGEKKLYYDYDGHFTSEGHKLMASGYVQYLNSIDWGEKCD